MLLCGFLLILLSLILNYTAELESELCQETRGLQGNKCGIVEVCLCQFTKVQKKVNAVLQIVLISNRSCFKKDTVEKSVAFLYIFSDKGLFMRNPDNASTKLFGSIVLFDTLHKPCLQSVCRALLLHLMNWTRSFMWLL